MASMNQHHPQPTSAGKKRFLPAIVLPLIGGPVFAAAFVAVCGTLASGTTSWVEKPVVYAPRPVPDAIDGNLVDPLVGRQLFARNCSSCHGANGEGMPMQGNSLARSQFVAKQKDTGLVKFITNGRKPGSPDTVLNRLMPPKGGNPELVEAELCDIVAYLRQLQLTNLQ
jgi:mono/diheme cytochrome c family protein